MSRLLPSLHMMGALVLAGFLSSACSRSPQLDFHGGGSLRAAVSVSTNAIYVGDPVQLRLIVEHPVGTTAQVEPFERGDDIVVLDSSTRTHQEGAELQRTEFSWTVTSFAPGGQALSTNSILALAKDQEPLRIPFPEVSIQVRSMLPDDAEVDPRAMKPPMEWPSALPRRLLPALLAVALIAVLVGLFCGWFMGRRRVALAPPPPIDPHAQALASLQALADRKLIEKGEAEPFYIELSAIVRHFIERRFGLKAPELTTEEFIREATDSGQLRPAHQDLVRQFLEQSDMVKFARFQPEPADMRAGFEAAERLVNETRASGPGEVVP